MIRGLRHIVSCLLLATAGSGRTAEPRPAAELPLDEKKELDRVPQCVWLGFSPDGKWVAARHEATDTEQRIRVWATEGWKSHHWHIRDRVLSFGRYKACAFAADSGTLYALGSQWLYAGSLPPAGRPVASNLTLGKRDAEMIHAAALSADGKALVVATTDGIGSFRLDLVPPGDPRDFRPLFETKVRQLRAFAVSRDGGLCALGSDAGPELAEHALEVWETAPPKRRFQHQMPLGSFSAVAFDPKGAWVATGSNHGVFQVWDAKTGRILAQRERDGTVLSVDFHPTRGLVVYGTADAHGNSNCQVVEAPSGRAVTSWSADARGVSVARFSPDGKWLATAGGEGVVRLWAVKDVAGN
jgi:WD40 repeat protein